MKRRAAMEYFAGLDVSMEETHVIVVDRDGKVILEARTPTAPKTIAAALAKGPAVERVLFETGRMVPMLFHGLTALGYKFLFAFGRGADDHQQALRGLLEPGLHMDAIDPEVNVAFGREITLAPTRMLVRPGLLEPPDGRGREPAGILAEQCDQRLLEITGGDALQVENRDQHLGHARAGTAPRLHRCRS